MYERRIDRGGLLLHVERHPGNGSVTIKARPTRTGVFPYLTTEGTIRREWRRDAEVFSPRSLASYKGAIITVGHPPTGTVDTRNAKQYQVGIATREGKRDGKYVDAEYLITDEDAIAKLDSGELADNSVGYKVELDRTPGVTPDGERYDAIQTGIVVEHIALLPRGDGRAGEDCGVRYDAADKTMAIQVAEKRKDTAMAMIEIDGEEYERNSEEATVAFLALVAKLEGERDQAIANAKDANERTDKAEKTIKRARLSHMIDRACRLVPRFDKKKIEAEADAGKLTLADVVKRVLKQKNPKMNLEGKSEDYLMGAFELLQPGDETSEEDEATTTAAAGAGAAPKGAALDGRDWLRNDADDVSSSSGMRADAKDPLVQALEERRKRKLAKPTAN